MAFGPACFAGLFLLVETGDTMHMKRLMLTIFMLAYAVSAWAGAQTGTITMVFDLSHQKAGEEVKLWLPYPVSDADQVVTDVSYRGDYAEAGIYTDRRFGNPILTVRWDAAAKERHLTFTFKLQRDEVEHRELPEQEAAWDPADYALYLGPTRLGPIDGPVKELAERIVKGKVTVKDKARALYDWICENMFRDPATRGCGEGDVCVLLLAPGGKCADIHSVYVALARSVGVPAREVFGIRQGKGGETDITTWQHCWAEFYLPGYGWVPIDPSDVRKKMLTENLTLESPMTAVYRDYFWGGIDAYRVKLSTGRDIKLPGAPQGQPLNYLMYPYAEVGGKPLDWLDPATFRYTITHYK